ncbi:MAG: hypothetical protein NZ602_04870 [Thermoguttaceae bacterium]|nr:hypothetical protein [Thermoguttaceae bacterium]MDW8039670.1 hypothetical protein [Thermoguttaceae bacterium]
MRPMHWWIGGGILAVVVSSLGLATSWSYIKTAWLGIGETIRDATPIAFDLQRLNVAIKDLESESRQNQKFVAQLEVEIEYQEKEVAKLKEEQDKALAEMRKLREALGENKSEFQFAGRKYTRPEVEQDLKRRMDVYQERETELKAKEQLLQSRRQTLEAARKKAAEYRRQYDQLVAKAQALQAELKLLEAAQATSPASIDASKLSEAKQLAQEIEKRIRVSQRMLDAERKPLEGEIPVDVDDRPVTERFDELFGPKEKSQPASDSKQT